MEDLLKQISPSSVNFIGMAFLLFLGGGAIVFGQRFWDYMWKRWFVMGKEKRGETGLRHNGIERRADYSHLDKSIQQLIESMNEFVTMMKVSHEELNGAIGEIGRKQVRNWDRAFDEEFPAVKQAIKESKKVNNHDE